MAATRQHSVCRAALGLTLVSLVAPIAAHVCVLYPPQRGPALPTPLSAAEDLCYRRTPYCGGVAVPPVATTSFLAGEPAVITFQQNLNHFHEQRPGFLDIAISYDLQPKDSSWSTLAKMDDFAANDMATQTNFTVSVNMPVQPSEHAILRFRYISNNAGEVDPANNTASIFYNCADIRIIGMPPVTTHQRSTTVSRTPVRPMTNAPLSLQSRRIHGNATANGCSTATNWVATAIETTVRGAVMHDIIYSASEQAVKWNRRGPVRQAHMIEDITTLSLYGKTIPKQPPTAHPEYVLGMGGADKCVMWGADPMYTWQYGPNRNQQFVREFMASGSRVEEWASLDNLHTFLVRRDSDGSPDCEPWMETHPDRTLVFTSFVPNAPIPEGTFDVPASCTHAVMGHGFN